MSYEWKSVKSSNIDAIKLDDDALRIRFKNGTQYAYSGVPESVFQEIVAADSVGKSFNQLVRSQEDKYPFVQEH